MAPAEAGAISLCGMADNIRNHIQFAGLDVPVTETVVVHLQPRCVFCGREHYGPAVVDISHGREGCGVCGLKPPVFTSQATYDQFMRGYCCPRCHFLTTDPDHLVHGWCPKCEAGTAVDIVPGRRVR